MKEAVIDKIRKLLALASNNSSVHEAANAAARALELLFEHKLSMAEVSLSPEEQNEGIESTFYSQDGARHITWESDLLYGVSTTNFCRLIETWRDRKASYKIIGKKSDADTVVYLYEYLTKEIKRLSVESGNAYKEYMLGISLGKAWYNSFKRGAVTTINRRLREARQASLASSEKALVLVKTSNEELEAFIKTAFPNLRKSHSSDTVSNGKAFRAGAAAAANIGLPGSQKGLGGAPKMLQ